jgi:hypothetical protein
VAGLLAAACVALHPFPVGLGRTVRVQYALGCWLAVVSSWLLVEAVRDPRHRWRWWLGYAVAAAAFAYSHYYAVFTLAAQALFVGWQVARAWKDGRVGAAALAVRYLTAAGLAAALYAPWLPSLARQAESVRASFWIPEPTVEYVRPMAFSFLTGFAAPDPLAEYAAWAVGLAVVIAMARCGAEGLFVLLLTLCPWLGGLGYSVVSGRPILEPRYLLFSHVFYLVALAAAVCLCRARAARGWLAALLLVNFGLALGQAVSSQGAPGRSVERLAQSLARGYEAGEPVVIDSPATANRLLYYLSRDGVAVRSLVIGAAAPAPGHQVHAASIPAGEWVAREAVARVSGDSLWSVASPEGFPDLGAGWRAASEEVGTDEDGTCLALVHWVREAE